MTEKLKPCPFCGSEATVRNAFGIYACTCSLCGITTEPRGEEKQAVDVWNARPIEDAQMAEIARLREALKKNQR